MVLGTRLKMVGQITAWSMMMLLAPVVLAQAVPAQMTYDGYLTDSDGVAVNDMVTLSLGLSESESGGTLLWSEEREDVVVSEGYFSLRLGDQLPLDAEIFDGRALFLAVWVNGDEILPRQAISTVAYAFRAEQANDVAGRVIHPDGVFIGDTEVINSDGEWVGPSTGLQGPRGESGVPGASGQACWDLNGNGACDADAEDMNQDGGCSVQDCRGGDGEDGIDGADGTSSLTLIRPAQPPWAEGCRLLVVGHDDNGDGDLDPHEKDGETVICDGEDGAGGSKGDPGADGQACWDLNGNGTCQPNEDVNQDDACNVQDCRGEIGPQGASGQPGAACWDLNGNDFCEPGEDINRDTVCDVQDCQGAEGQAGGSCRVTEENGDKIVVCDDGSRESLGAPSPWKLVHAENFDSGAEGWNVNTTTTCGNSTILGGYNVAGRGRPLQKYLSLAGIPHTHVKIKFNYYAIDSWDGGTDVGFVKINGRTVWSQALVYTDPSREELCGSGAWPDGMISADGFIEHSGDLLEIRFDSGLTEALNNESFGIDNLEVWVKNETAQTRPSLAQPVIETISGGPLSVLAAYNQRSGQAVREPFRRSTEASGGANVWTSDGKEDLTTLREICDGLGYKAYIGSTCLDTERTSRYPNGKCNYHSPSDNELFYFDGNSWQVQRAPDKFTHTWVSTITCAFPKD